MAFQDIIQKIGQVAGAMNPSYQAGAQMAQQEMQRKKMNILMSSPMMQKAIMSTWGPEMGPLMIQAAGAGPQVFSGFANMFPAQKGDIPNTPFEYWMSRNYGQPVSEFYKQNPPAGRTPKSPDELYQDYVISMIKGQNPMMQFIIQQIAKQQGINMPTNTILSKPEFIRLIGGRGQQFQPIPTPSQQTSGWQGPGPYRIDGQEMQINSEEEFNRIMSE